jgi:nitrite reductase (NADH) small subunit
MPEPILEVCLGPVDQVPPGEGRAFVVGERRIAVFRERDGALHAVDDRCPHQDAPLSDGLLRAGHVICLHHGYRFDLATGDCLTDPACRIHPFGIRVEAGAIWVTPGGEDEPRSSG